MRKNNNVHTGANIQLGGLKNGLFNTWYQLLIEGAVTVDPRYAVEKQRKRDKRK